MKDYLRHFLLRHGCLLVIPSFAIGGFLIMAFFLYYGFVIVGGWILLPGAIFTMMFNDTIDRKIHDPSTVSTVLCGPLALHWIGIRLLRRRAAEAKGLTLHEQLYRYGRPLDESDVEAP